MSRGLRHSSEQLANILNSPPFPGQAERLKAFLSECQTNGFSLTALINYNIPRYNGRTLVHIAANNGLFGCLEELLKLEGICNKLNYAARHASLLRNCMGGEMSASKLLFVAFLCIYFGACLFQLASNCRISYTRFHFTLIA